MYHVSVFTSLGIWKSHSSLCNILKAAVMLATVALPIVFESEPHETFKFLFGIILGIFRIVKSVTAKLRIAKITKKVIMPIKNLLTSFMRLYFNPKFFELA